MGTDKNFDPDILLADLALEHKRAAKNGKLRVFLGMCPGVGKTFAMLRAAQDLKKEGVDIVIGLVEAHGRAETENIIQGLEIIPRKKLSYRNTILEEMDIDAILERRPKIVLVDELAHTNIPGSRHAKRYQDVEEILRHGIDVFTTLNVQHLETRSEIVSKITGVVIRETVPDSIVSNSHQIELIDLNPDELLKRLQEGKVYLGDMATNALENFFKIEHLTALREIALRFTAEIVDTHLKTEMTSKGIKGAWHTSDRLLVAISHSPYSPKLLRAARRKAQSLEAPWIALYVENGTHLAEEDKAQLNKNIKMAKDLGAEFISVYDDDIVSAIKRIALQRNVSQIIMGRPDRRFSDIYKRGSLLERLTYDLTDVDILVLKQEKRKRRGLRFKLRKLFEIHTGIQSYYNTVAIIAVASLVLHFTRDIIGYRSIGFIYLLLVLFISSVAGKGVISFTALVTAMVWNFFFIPPFGTFHIDQREDLMLFFTFFVVAMVTGYLSSEKRKKQQILIEREERTNLLFETSKSLARATDIDQLLGVCKQSVKRLLSLDVEVFLIDRHDNLSLDKEMLRTSDFKLSDSEVAVSLWSLKNRAKAGFLTETLSSSKIQAIPLSTEARNYGVLVLRKVDHAIISHLNENILDTIVQLVTESLEKNHLELQAELNVILKESEKLHQALFNSVSHEMKTPITAIMGTATSLLEDRSHPLDEYIRKNLNSIKVSSYRLNRVVVNLLDMSRLSSGVNKLQLEYFDLKEFLDNIIITFFKENNVKLIVDTDKDMIISADAKLLEHAFINLIQNAFQYSAPGLEVIIHATLSEQEAKIEVVDQGIGIPAGEEERIFERFYRGKNASAGGTGLGLSIVKEVLMLHGGSIKAFNNKVRGSCFTVILPLNVRSLE